MSMEPLGVGRAPCSLWGLEEGPVLQNGDPGRLGGGGDSLLLANKETAHLISCKVSLGTDPTSTQPLSLSAYANGPLGESRVCFLDRESGHSSGIKEGSSAFCAFRLPGGR